MTKYLFCLISCMVINWGFTQELSWVVQSGGNSFDLVTDVAVESNGSIYSTGSVSGSAMFGALNYESNTLPVFGGEKGYIQKLNAEGIVERVVILDGDGASHGQNISVDKDGNIFLVGYFGGSIDFDPDSSETHILNSETQFNLFVLKLNASMEFQWVVSFSENLYYMEADITIDNEGNIYVGGLFTDSVDVDPIEKHILKSQGSSDVFVVKYNPSGKLVWAKSMGSSRNDALLELKYDPFTNTILSTGYFREQILRSSDDEHIDINSVGSWDVFVQKMDTSGIILWTRSFGGALWDTGYTLDVDSEGNIYTAGSFFAEADFDPGMGDFQLVPQSGDTTGLTSNDDGFIQKMDKDGNFIWARALNSKGTAIVYDLAVDQDQHVIVTGNFSGKLTFSNQQSDNLSTDGNDSPFFTAFLCRYSPEGENLQVSSLGGVDPSIDQRIQILEDNSIILAGNFSESVSFDPNDKTKLHSSRGALDAYVARFTEQTVGIEDEYDKEQLILFPNPAHRTLYLQGDDTEGRKYTVEVMDINGGSMFHKEYILGEPLDISQLPQGFYTLTLLGEGQKRVLRWVKY